MHPLVISYNYDQHNDLEQKVKKHYEKRQEIAYWRGTNELDITKAEIPINKVPLIYWQVLSANSSTTQTPIIIVGPERLKKQVQEIKERFQEEFERQNNTIIFSESTEGTITSTYQSIEQALEQNNIRNKKILFASGDLPWCKYDITISDALQDHDLVIPWNSMSLIWGEEVLKTYPAGPYPRNYQFKIESDYAKEPNIIGINIESNIRILHEKLYGMRKAITPQGIMRLGLAGAKIVVNQPATILKALKAYFMTKKLGEYNPAWLPLSHAQIEQIVEKNNIRAKSTHNDKPQHLIDLDTSTDRAYIELITRLYHPASDLIRTVETNNQTFEQYEQKLHEIIGINPPSGDDNPIEYLKQFPKTKHDSKAITNQATIIAYMLRIK